jgi:RNA 2',3'-cyclic 3'-phosphodiesterase
LRLFVAVDLPAEMRAHLETLLTLLRREARDVRWARSSGVHLTLKFLGEVEESRLGSLGAALGRAAGSVAGGFPLAIGGFGTFGDRRRPRVVWLGAREESGALMRLAAAIESACGSEGFPREDRAFSPHLTLARLKSPSRSLQKALAAGEPGELGSLQVTSFVLFQSLLRPEGAEYVKIREFPLAASRGSMP